MITLDQFVTQHTGHFLDYDHAYGNQCVDLAQFYTTEVIGAPAFIGGAAIDFWQTYPQSDYVRIANTPTNHPVAGDIIIWTGPNAQVGTDGYGHIAICLQASVQGFTSLDQNWDIGTPCHAQQHTYTAVEGWLHPTKVNPVPAPTTPPPVDAAAAVAVLARHVELLTAHPSVSDTNALVHGISTWPIFKS